MDVRGKERNSQVDEFLLMLMDFLIIAASLAKGNTTTDVVRVKEKGGM